MVQRFGAVCAAGAHPFGRNGRGALPIRSSMTGSPRIDGALRQAGWPTVAQPEPTAEDLTVDEGEGAFEAGPPKDSHPPAPRPGSREAAWNAFRFDPVQQQLKLRVEQTHDTRQASRPSDPPASEEAVSPFSDRARENAEEALSAPGYIRQEHAFAKAHDADRMVVDNLNLLDSEPSERPRIVVNDRNRDHGASVTRAVAGSSTFGRGAEVYLDFDEASAETRSKLFSKEENSLYSSVGERREQLKDNQLGLDAMAELAADEQVEKMMSQAAELREIRDDKPNDGRAALVNMSWGTSPARALETKVTFALRAPEGSATYDDVVELLDHGPPYTKEDEAAVRNSLVQRYRAAEQDPDRIERRASIHATFENEVTEARSEGILIFRASGNEGKLATESYEDYGASKLAGANVAGIIDVGAVDENGVGFADDRIADLSGAEPEIVSRGIDMAVGPAGEKDNNGLRWRSDKNGTSFASPDALATAYAMMSANPDLSVDQLADLMQDPRVLKDLKDTERDGLGHLVTVPAILAAKYPDLSRSELVQLWNHGIGKELPPDQRTERVNEILFRNSGD